MDTSGSMILLFGIASLMKGALVMKIEKKWKRGNVEIITTNELIKIVANYIRKNP